MIGGAFHSICKMKSCDRHCIDKHPYTIIAIIRQPYTAFNDVFLCYKHFYIIIYLNNLNESLIKTWNAVLVAWCVCCNLQISNGYDNVFKDFYKSDYCTTVSTWTVVVCADSHSELFLFDKNAYYFRNHYKYFKEKKLEGGCFLSVASLMILTFKATQHW